MRYQIHFHPIAELELLESSKWYAEKNLLIYQNFISDIESLTSIIQKEPLVFQIAYENKRKANLKRFPYSIVYAIHGNRILIYSVFHNSRNPKIWKNRK